MSKKIVKKPEAEIDKKIRDTTHDVRKKLGAIDFHLDQIKSAMARNEENKMTDRHPLRTPISEIAKSTLFKYHTKAMDDLDAKSFDHGHNFGLNDKTPPSDDERAENRKAEKHIAKRKAGMHLAMRKVAGRANQNATNEETIDEISKNVVGAYLDKAGPINAKGDPEYQVNRRGKLRNKGHDMALSKKYGTAKVLAKEGTELDEAMDMSGFIEVGLFNDDQKQVRLVRHPNHFDEHYVLDGNGNLHSAYTGPTGHVIDQMAKDGYSQDTSSNDVTERRDERTFNYPNKIKEIRPEGKGHVIVRLHSGERYHVHASETGGVIPKMGSRLDTSQHRMVEGINEEELDEGRTFKDSDKYSDARSKNFGKALRKSSRFRKDARSNTRQVKDVKEEEEIDEQRSGFVGLETAKKAAQKETKNLGTIRHVNRDANGHHTLSSVYSNKTVISFERGQPFNDKTVKEETIDEKDLGKPGKNFDKIARKSGGGEKGARIAGAILAKLRARHPRAYAEETEIEEGSAAGFMAFRSKTASTDSLVKDFKAKGGKVTRAATQPMDDRLKYRANYARGMTSANAEVMKDPNNPAAASKTLKYNRTVDKMKSAHFHAQQSGYKTEEVEIEEALRLVGTHGEGSKTAKVYRDAEWEEYRVKHYTDGVHHKKADYHTNDKHDAHSTAQAWTKKANEEVEQVDELSGVAVDKYQKAARHFIARNRKDQSAINHRTIGTKMASDKMIGAARVNATEEAEIDEGRSFRVDVDGGTGRTVIRAKKYRDALKKASAQQRHNSLNKRNTTVNNID